MKLSGLPERQSDLLHVFQGCAVAAAPPAPDPVRRLQEPEGVRAARPREGHRGAGRGMVLAQAADAPGWQFNSIKLVQALFKCLFGPFIGPF